MPPDPTPLATAARRKSEHAYARAGKALREQVRELKSELAIAYGQRRAQH